MFFIIPQVLHLSKIFFWVPIIFLWISRNPIKQDHWNWNHNHAMLQYHFQSKQGKVCVLFQDLVGRSKYHFLESTRWRILCWYMRVFRSPPLFCSSKASPMSSTSLLSFHLSSSLSSSSSFPEIMEIKIMTLFKKAPSDRWLISHQYHHHHHHHLALAGLRPAGPRYIVGLK